MKTETLATPPLPPSPPPVAPALPLRPRRAWQLPTAALLLAATAVGGWQLTHKAPAAAAPVAKATPKVEALELASADVATVGSDALALSLPLSGSLTPLTQATVKSKVSGVVSISMVQEGMAVAAGQVLARIDSADLQARLMQQQAMLDEARAKLSLANKNQTNNQTLLQQKYISQTAYDTMQNSVELAQANVKSATAMVEIARIALADGVIRAPFAGIVSKRFVQAGDKLAIDLPVFTIVDLRVLTLEAQVPASDIPRVKQGQAVSFHVDGYPQRRFAGTVARINPTAEAGSRSMLVYISVDNRDGALRGGMFAKGALTTERSAIGPLVPLAAIHTDQGATRVYTVEHNKLVARTVTLGMRNEDEGLAEVTAGLAPGSTVLLARLDGLKDGLVVKLPAPATLPASLPAGTAVAAANVPGKG